MAVDRDMSRAVDAGDAHTQEGPGPEGILRRLLRDRAALVGLVIVSIFTLAAIAAPLLAPHDPIEIDPIERLQGPSLEHPLGTDNLGRDTASRMLYGSRWSMGTALVATALVMSIGVAVGTLAGFYGGWVDALLMRLVDVLLGFPNLILALAIVGTLGPGIWNVMIGLVVVWWVDYARIVRGLVLSFREREFVESAVAMGATDLWIMRRHILPNVIPPVVVLASLEMGSLLLAISGLSFLGLGVQPPTPEWGAMLNQGRLYLTQAPQLMIFPGLAISLVVLGFNLIGDGIRDALDPRLEL